MGAYFAYAAALSSGLLFPKSRVVVTLLALLSIFFIGLRFETGYDWPVYKQMFHDFGLASGLDDFLTIKEKYNQEILFVIFISFLSKILYNYESAQLLFALLLIISLIYAAIGMNSKKIALFFVISISYIIFTLGFSTVRQSIAVSLFNFAIFLYARKRHIWCALLMVLAYSIQNTTIIYVSAFILAATSIKFRHWQYDAIIAFSVTLVCFLGAVTFLYLAQAGLTFGSERIKFYINIFSQQTPNNWDWFFTLILIVITTHVVISAILSKRTPIEIFTARFIIILGAIAAVSISLPIVRDRASYQMWIAYAAFLTYNTTFMRRTAIFASLIFAIIFARISTFTYPGSMMFVPYQNSLSGIFGYSYPERQYGVFLERYREINERRLGEFE